MATKYDFPHDYYLETLVRLLDIIKHEDKNYTDEQRLENLRYVYAKSAEHFAQPSEQATLKVSHKRLQASLQTIVSMVVYCWAHASKELMADLTIHYTYTLLLDDSTDDPNINMTTYYEDLLNGRQQKHPWWQLVNGHFPKVLSHFGPFCSLNLVRSTIDFFEGCWIEQYNFLGFPGSHEYPQFLRRMNGLGHCVGASLFPKSQFDEQALFVQIVSVIAQMETWMVYVNDMMSYYKESMAERDQTSLVNNYVQCEGITLNEALEKLTCDVIHCSEQMVTVFEGKDPQLVAAVNTFIQGYVTWHLCDERYRLDELYERGKDTPAGMKFRGYQEKARKVGVVDSNTWARPTIATLVEQNHAAIPSLAPSDSIEEEKSDRGGRVQQKSKIKLLCALFRR